ncbi:MAG: ATP-dependent helicase, partial [Thermoleophilaceae bacterium]|nr:ATP-dependent helicase [Thermoleophilaceae bacterium]
MSGSASTTAPDAEVSGPNAITAARGTQLTGLSSALEGLNPEQRTAVTHSGGPLLIVAGAGSGKTRTLTYRFAWLVSEGTPADRILAVTYTAAAAEELVERIEQMVPVSEDLNATTIHSMCLAILKDEAAEAGISEFVQAATTADRLAIMLGRIDELEIRHLQLRGQAPSKIKDWLDKIDRLKEENIGPQQFGEWAQSTVTAADSEESLATAQLELEFSKAYAQHEKFLAEAGVIDFGGMQMQLLRLLQSKPHVRKRIAGRFDHVLVDEFQDTSFVQLEILRELVSDHHNITVVGDDDQSIYRFRGASSKNILEFEQRFGKATQVMLEINYRSAAAIVDTARAVVTAIPASQRIDKNLTACGELEGRVRFFRGDTKRAQTLAIAHEIEHLIINDEVAPSEICVLVNKRAQVEALQDALELRQLPVDYASANDFFDRIEIRDIVAWLKLLADPNDHSALTRALMRYPVGLEAAELAQINRSMTRRHDNLFPALEAATRNDRFAPETVEKIRSFLSLYKRASDLMDELRPASFVERLIKSVGTHTALVSDHGDEIARFANLGQLLEMAEVFGSARPSALAREFAEYLAAMTDAGIAVAPAQPYSTREAVKIMTWHKSKGLEFDYVFVPDLVRTAMSSKTPTEIPDALLPESLPDASDAKAEGMEIKEQEFRRMLHVAMTRARRELFLTVYAKKDKNSNRSNPVASFDDALLSAGCEVEEFEEAQFGWEQGVYELLLEWRSRVLRAAEDVGTELFEPRLDAHADTPNSLAEFAEYIKLNALVHRIQHGHTLAQALPEVNAMVVAGLSPAQRSAFEKSSLDDRLLGDAALQQERERVLEALRPTLSNYVRRGGTNKTKIQLSASDIKAYQRCPQQYAYERIKRVPSARSAALKLGIAVHTTLERYHKQYNEQPMSVEEAEDWLANAFETLVRTSGLGDSSD